MNHLQQIELLQKIFPFLETEDIHSLFSIATYKKLKNKEKLPESHSILFFILKGMIRGYFYDELGEEKNIILKPEHNFSGMPASDLRPLRKEYVFQAINETEILLFSFQDFEKLSFQSLNISRLYIEGLKENVFTLLFRIEILASKSPAERYEALIKHHPQFFQRTYHKHIASYLGITPNSLSRIIKRRIKE